MQRVLVGKLITELSPEHVDYIRHSEQIEELMYYLEITYNVALSQWEHFSISFSSNINTNHIRSSLLAGEGLLVDYLQKMMKKIHYSAVVESSEDFLFSEMKDHLRSVTNRPVFRVECHDLSYGEIERQHSLVYELARTGLQELGRLLNRCVSTVEFGYLALHFEPTSRRNYEAGVKKEIAVICSTGHGTALIIQRQLEKVLGPDIQTAYFSEEEVERRELNRYLATSTIIPLKNIRPQTPVIHLTNLSNDTWFRNEWQRAKEICSVESQDIHMIYQLLENTRGYRASAQKVVADLEAEKLVDPRFIERIFIREDQQTTTLESGIVFSHTINQALPAIILPIGVFEESLVTPEGKADVISLLGTPEELTVTVEAELLQLYDHSSTIAGDERLRNELRKQRDVLVVREWIQRKGIII